MYESDISCVSLPIKKEEYPDPSYRNEAIKRALRVRSLHYVNKSNLSAPNKAYTKNEYTSYKANSERHSQLSAK